MSGYNSETLSEAVARRRAAKCTMPGCGKPNLGVGDAVITVRWQVRRSRGGEAMNLKLSEAQEDALSVARHHGWVSPGKYPHWVAQGTLMALVRRGLLEEAINATGMIEYRPVAQTVVKDDDGEV